MDLRFARMLSIGTINELTLYYYISGLSGNFKLLFVNLNNVRKFFFLFKVIVILETKNKQYM